MRQSLWYGSLLVMISGSLLACVAAPDSEDAPPPRAVTQTRKAGVEAEIAVGPRGNLQNAEGESARAGEAGYPAPHPSMPQIPIHGGVVLHDPEIVSVTFPGDELADKLRVLFSEVPEFDMGGVLYARAVALRGLEEGWHSFSQFLSEGECEDMRYRLRQYGSESDQVHASFIANHLNVCITAEQLQKGGNKSWKILP